MSLYKHCEHCHLKANFLAVILMDVLSQKTFACVHSSRVKVVGGQTEDVDMVDRPPILLHSFGTSTV